MTWIVGIPALERAIVRHCSPTLAGLKPAGLFTFPGDFARGGDAPARRAELERAAAACAASVAAAGVRVRVLCWRATGALVYVYRPAVLASHLADPRAARPLAERGYRSSDLEGSLRRLGARLAGGAAFPHELGYFLGYPYDDVAGFIEHGGRDCILAGPWKVYSDRTGALRTFERYRRCADLYERAYRRRGGLDGLARRCA